MNDKFTDSKNDQTAGEARHLRLVSPVVTWQAAKLRPVDRDMPTLNAWILSVDGKAILTATAGSDLHESVSSENRRMIGQALVDYLANV
ncbi:hypothetical protein ACFSSA_08805 [Luteolibacter algae]|uniref:Uncharacterized protein n=1 Tax=Luteolibacter algae TaxID=454151 RepID=A0ABW5D7C5_9BACT